MRMIAGAAVLMVFTSAPIRGQTDSSVTASLDFAARQLKATAAEVNDSTLFPRSTNGDGSWNTVPPRDWTSGFFPGCLWYMYEQTGDRFFEHAARRWTDGLREIQYFGGSHDVGFMVFNSFGNGYRIEPSDDYRNVILQTAATLAKRYHPIVGCIRSWDHRKWEYPVIIDNMMNLELLFWASDHGGPPLLHEIAARHAETTMKNQFRSDGSTYHVLDYDTTNGSVIARTTHQGYSDESVWARGQAWAIYGFTMSYRYTKDKRFLRTAERAADYFVQHLPADHVPYWDFKAPGIPDEPRDASAGAIAASALLELSGYAGAEKSTFYHGAALAIIGSLCHAPYLAEGTHSHGILNHAVGNKPANSEVDVSLIYGDYYFIEALVRYERGVQ
jgi:unsaturated chondroitin disaccharide hydrolase